MKTKTVVDLRWLSLSYGLRGAQLALEKAKPGEAVELIADAFAASELKSSLETLGYQVEYLREQNNQSSVTLIVKNNPQTND